MTKFNVTDSLFKEMVLDLLIDILATNKDIIDRIDATYEYEIDENYNENYNREMILQYLESKYGDMKKPLSDYLKTKGINKSK